MNNFYDAVVIGGGINGSGIALILAAANKKTLLLEEDDFASKTSGASTKLLHGGLRYLQTFELGLVYEGLQERSRLLEISTKKANAHSLKLIIPVYKNSSVPLWKIKLGTFAYDILSWLGLPSSKKDFPFSGNLKISDYQNILKTEGLKGLRYYFDGQVDDKQLVKDEIATAINFGAEALSSCKVNKITYDQTNKIYTTTYQDKTGKLISIKSKKIINCAGPWVKQIDSFAGIDSNIELSYVAGTHIIIDKHISNDGFFIMTKDGRNIFVLPWQNNTTLVGTTEERVHENDIFNNNIPRQNKAPQRWQNYLIDNFNEFFQDNISQQNIVGSLWGIRVLVKNKGRSDNRTSRKVKIVQHLPGYVSVYGGKLTAHLSTARRIFKMLYKEKTPIIGNLIIH